MRSSCARAARASHVRAARNACSSAVERGQRRALQKKRREDAAVPGHSHRRVLTLPASLSLHHHCQEAKSVGGGSGGGGGGGGGRRRRGINYAKDDTTI